MSRSAKIQALLAVLLLLMIWVVVGLGSDQGRIIFDPGWISRADLSTLDYDILWTWRLPRVCAGILVGAALALSGATLQVVTRNPLADPYLLGISGGGGLAVVLGQALARADLPWWTTPMIAFLGALAAALLVAMFARGGTGRLTVVSLILAGVVVNAFCAAMITFITTRMDPFRLRITTLWLVGGIGFIRWSELIVVAVLVVVCGVVLRVDAHRLNALALGADGAAALGVDVRRLISRSVAMASLLAALSVACSGLLGYVGLIIPHLIRLLVGSDVRKLLPLSATAGAILLILSDGVARVILAPEELPVGVLTALLGCPTLLLLLKQQLRKGRIHA